jgi:hypothetical protein
MILLVVANLGTTCAELAASPLASNSLVSPATWRCQCWPWAYRCWSWPATFTGSNTF